MTAVLEKAVENGDLSHKGVLDAVQDVGTISFDGLGGDYEYGPIDKRSPSRESSIFAVKASEPFGLQAIETNKASEAAQKFEFGEGGGS